ncbi:WD40 repeat protein [Saccharothrix carnea]|uniref:WD40 repeat protein n=1 Tax=Saccharothrix carnea TaxID=1280637 RepID=A0A2P8IBF5_SACCR|nr:WD40 repeat domain-containing protein [Saccharothrix carnea]PSL55795.1 WD40 repeat protein [Saccharothrix carnea]
MAGLAGEPVVLNASYGDVRAWRVADGTRLFTLSAHVWSGPPALGDVAGRAVLATSGNDELIGEGSDEPVTATRTWLVVDGGLIGHGDRGLIRLWDPVDGVETGRIEVPGGVVTDLAWGRWNGRDVLAGSVDDGLVRLWDVEGAVVASFPGTAPLAWGEVDGRAVLATRTADGDAQVWDGEPRTLRTPDGVTALAWGEVAGRPVLACAGKRGRVRLWSDFARRPAAELTTAFTWDPTGRLLAAGSAAGRVAVHGPDGASSFTAHDGVVVALAWGAAALATATAEGEVRLWDPATGALVAEPPVRPGYPILFDWVRPAEGDRLVVARGSADVELCAPDGTSRPLDLPPWGHPVRSLTNASTDAGEVVLSAAGDELRLLDPDTLEQVDVLRQGMRYADVDAESAVAVGITPDGVGVARGGDAGSLSFWEPGTSLLHPGTWMRDVPVDHAHDGRVNAVVWLPHHPDGPRVATGGDDGAVRLWDPAEPDRPSGITGAGGAVRALESVGDVLVVGTADGTVRVHRVPDGDEPHVLPGTGAAVESLASVMTDSGLYVAIGTGDGTLRLWSTWSGEVHDEPVDAGAILALAWGEVEGVPVLGLGLADGRVGWWRLYEPDGERALTEWTGPAVTALTWTAHGRLLCAGFQDGSLWTLDPTGTTEGRAAPPPPHGDGAMTTGLMDGRAVLAAGGGGAPFRVWDIEESALLVVDAYLGTDGRLLRWGEDRVVAARGPGTVRLVDPVDGTVRHEVEVPEDFDALELAFGRLHGRAVCAVATRAGAITVVDVEDGTRRTVEWHEPVLGLAFGADDRLAIRDAYGCTVILLR